MKIMSVISNARLPPPTSPTSSVASITETISLTSEGSTEHERSLPMVKESYTPIKSLFAFGNEAKDAIEVDKIRNTPNRIRRISAANYF